MSNLTSFLYAVAFSLTSSAALANPPPTHPKVSGNGIAQGHGFIFRK